MTNEEVIESLENIIAALNTRLAELRTFQNVPGGPIEERTLRRAQMVSEISRLNVELTHLENRKRDRTAARNLGRAVPPLSQERRKAMEDALANLTSDIRADGDFHAALDVARQLVAAAQSANDASVIG